MRAEWKQFFGWHWRTVTRPRILARAGGKFFKAGRYLGFACCERCHAMELRLAPGQPSMIEIAHLEIPPGEPGHDSDENLAALCRRCHRSHDYKAWAVRLHAWLYERWCARADAKDAARPILEVLRRGQRAQAAVDALVEGKR